jgi:hypothetical protein
VFHTAILRNASASRGRPFAPIRGTRGPLNPTSGPPANSFRRVGSSASKCSIMS